MGNTTVPINCRAQLVAAGWEEKWQTEIINDYPLRNADPFIKADVDTRLRVVISGWGAPRAYWSVLLVETYSFGSCYIIGSHFNIRSDKPLIKGEKNRQAKQEGPCQFDCVRCCEPHTELCDAFAACLDETADAP